MIGIVGASETCVNNIWEIGVDVIKEYRNNRLATYLVAKLTQELLIRNIIPFYSASQIETWFYTVLYGTFGFI